MLLLGSIALAGCGPSRYEYDHDYEERDRSRSEWRSRESYRPPRDRHDVRRAPVRDDRRDAQDRQVVAKSKAEPRTAAPQRPVDDKPAAAMQSTARAEPVQTGEPDKAPIINAPAATAPSIATARAEPEKDKPVVAEKPADPAAAKVDEASQDAGRKQIEDGYRLLRAGFVKKARERFERAMASNAAEASLGQGRSMDPSYLKTVAFPDVIPDAEQARRMYRRSILLGNAEAKADLDRLEKAMAAAAPTTIAPATDGAAPSSKTE